jgi:hypothetical protein
MNAGYLRESLIPIVLVKIIGPISCNGTPGVDYVEVQVTIVIEISPNRCAIIACASYTSLIRDFSKRPISSIFIKGVLQRWGKYPE